MTPVDLLGENGNWGTILGELQLSFRFLSTMKYVLNLKCANNSVARLGSVEEEG